MCESSCNPSPNILGSITEVSRNAGEKSFVSAFHVVVMGPKPAWFDYLPAEFQAPLTDLQNALGTLRSQVVANETPENEPAGARSSAAGEISSIIGTQPTV